MLTHTLKHGTMRKDAVMHKKSESVPSGAKVPLTYHAVDPNADRNPWFARLLSMLQRLFFVLVIIGGLGIPIAVYLTLFQIQSLPDWAWNGGRDSFPGILAYFLCWAATFVALMLVSFVRTMIIR
jgi:hypothetical protein